MGDQETRLIQLNGENLTLSAQASQDIEKWKAEQSSRKMSDRESLKVILEVAKKYPSFNVEDESMVREWANFLSWHVGLDEALANLEEHCRNSSYRPSLHDLARPNPRIRARREIERTRLMIEDQQKHIEKAIRPPWLDIGITREQYLDQVRERMKRDDTKQSEG